MVIHDDWPARSSWTLSGFMWTHCVNDSKSFDATWSWLLWRFVAVGFAPAWTAGVSLPAFMNWWLGGSQLTTAGQNGFFWIGAVVGLVTGIIVGITMATYYDSRDPQPRMWFVFLIGSTITGLLAAGILSCLISISNFPFPRNWF